MSKTIKATPDVKSVEDFKALIDAWGKAQTDLDLRIKEQKANKKKIEEFARLNGITSQRADEFRLSMKPDGARLVRSSSEMTHEEVLEKLKANAETAKAVYTDYDSDTIKDLAEQAEDRDAYLLQFGLKLSEQKRKAYIDPINR